MSVIWELRWAKDMDRCICHWWLHLISVSHSHDMHRLLIDVHFQPQLHRDFKQKIRQRLGNQCTFCPNEFKVLTFALLQTDQSICIHLFTEEESIHLQTLIYCCLSSSILHGLLARFPLTQSHKNVPQHTWLLVSVCMNVMRWNVI